MVISHSILECLCFSKFTSQLKVPISSCLFYHPFTISFGIFIIGMHYNLVTATLGKSLSLLLLSVSICIKFFCSFECLILSYCALDILYKRAGMKISKLPAEMGIIVSLSDSEWEAGFIRYVGEVEMNLLLL